MWPRPCLLSPKLQTGVLPRFFFRPFAINLFFCEASETGRWFFGARIGLDCLALEKRKTDQVVVCGGGGGVFCSKSGVRLVSFAAKGVF